MRRPGRRFYLQEHNIIPIRPILHHFVFSGTWSVDYRLVCWCGKSHRLSTSGWRVMTEGLNRFLAEHEGCVAQEGTYE